MELPPWPKTVDPWLQRTAWGLGIIVAALTLITHFIIPYYEAFGVLPNLAIAAWYAYSWRKDRTFLTFWWMQYAIVPSIATCLWGALLQFRQGSGYHILVGCLWLLPTAAWTALSIRTAYERHEFLMGILIRLAENDKIISERVSDGFVDGAYRDGWLEGVITSHLNMPGCKGLSKEERDQISKDAHSILSGTDNHKSEMTPAG
jgi:hypothetical protein